MIEEWCVGEKEMATRSLNKVMLIGNLTRDPELRYTPQGTAVCTFGLATNRSWQPSDGGERQESVEFHRIVAWQKLAELCAQLIFKGRKVFVEGRLQTRTWTGRDEQERTTTEIVIDNMIILDSKRKTDEGGGVGTQRWSAGRRDAIAAPADDQKTVKDEEENKRAKAEKTTEKAVKKEEEPSSVAPPAKPLVTHGKTTEPKEEVKADDIPF